MSDFSKASLPLITVVIPVYNASQYLARCINSVLNQSYDKLEIVLIDDGSTDESPLICDTYAKKDNRIRVFHMPNKGVSFARNYGIDLMNGEYLTFIDADDFISNNMIQVLYETITKYNASISTCHSRDFYDYSDVSFDESISSFSINVVLPQDYNYCEKYAHTIVWGALFKQSVIEELRFSNDIKVGEDTLFFAQAVLNANLVVDIDSPLYYYYIHQDSLSHKPYDYDRFTDVLARDLIVDLFSVNSNKSQLSCYGCRALVALKGFDENNRINDWENSLNCLLLEYIRKDLWKTLKSPISLRSRLSIVFVSIAPKLYLAIKKELRDT